MADLARRATRWVGTFPYILTPIPNLYDHSFPRYGQITFLTFRRPTTLTFDLKFWKYLSVTVYPYVICMPSFIMIGWEMAEILHIEILRNHGQTNTQTNTHTDRQTWALQYLALPLWGRGNHAIFCPTVLYVGSVPVNEHRFVRVGHFKHHRRWMKYIELNCE